MILALNANEKLEVELIQCGTEDLGLKVNVWHTSKVGTRVIGTVIKLKDFSKKDIGNMLRRVRK